MIKLFISSKARDCKACETARKYLKFNHFKYKEIDIVKNRDEANKMFKKTSQLILPQLEIAGEMVIGFNLNRIAEILNNLIEEKSK
tara:strand:- start:852 stop:1109 length:258 start_codon:yes stop_codon:yes gene_type:complete